MSIKQIAEGFFNNLWDANEGLYKRRLTVCSNCKLYIVDNVLGAMCNGNLCFNKETNQVSKEESPGFICGCGCILRLKCRVDDAECPLDKW